MFKKFLFLSSLLFFFLLSLTSVFAFDRPHFISFVNPIRGDEGWSASQSPLDLPYFQYVESTPSAFPITWLLRYDALDNATISAFFNSLSATDSNQTLGAFFEITPRLARAADVIYSEGEYMSAANRIFLSGYSQPDRLKLIDAYMQLFFTTYGYYPAVVGAWHLDSYSLAYLQKHYSVITAVICDEQYSTDNYRLWGGYLGSPYFPSKLNFLVPATTRENRIDIAVTKWAVRDPFNFYGQRSESAYSFQVNDYLAVGQKTDYFEKLLAVYSQSDFNEFSQVNIGIENDYDINAYKSEIKKTYSVLKQSQGKFNLRFISLPDFGAWLTNRYTFTNPAFFYQTKDITGRQTGTVYWYQNPFYRLGLKSQDGQTVILDFRLYNQAEAEEYYLTKNVSRRLSTEVNPIIDSVKYKSSAPVLPLDLERARITTSGWKVTFKEGGRELSLEPEKITFSGFAPPTLNTEEIRVKKEAGRITWQLAPKLPYQTTTQAAVFILITSLTLVVFLFIRAKTKKTRLLLLSGWTFGAVSLLTVIRSGLVYLFGLGFWGPNGHDAVFHLSLAESFKNNLSNLSHPQLAGEILKNYHFGFDWLTGLFGRLSAVPLLDIYFRLAPVVFIVCLVLLTARLLTLWRFGSLAIFLAFIFMFLAGSAGFIPALLGGRGLFAGESFFWANQSVSLLLNPPFALSLLVLLAFLLFLERRPHRLTLIDWLLLSLLGGLLVQIKIYAFVLLTLSLFLRRKFTLALGVGLFGLVFVLPSLSPAAGSPFIFSPLWFSRSMFESPDRLYWPRLAQAWQVYENNGRFVKLILVNLFALAVFLLGNLWVRVIGLARLVRGGDLTLSGRISQTMILLGLIIPLLFIQRVNPWNTIQFMYYSLFFLSFFTAEEISRWLANRRRYFPVILGVLAILLSLPTTVGTLADYSTRQSASRVSLTELRALDLLRRSPSGIVISPLTFRRRLSVPDPRPLYAYVSTAYISALTGQPEYLSDTINLDITGFDYRTRQKDVLRLYQTRDPLWVRQFLMKNKIKYVYETPYDQLKVRREDVCLTNIFESGEINLYRFDCDVN